MHSTFVTGASGYVGRRLLRALSASHPVVALTRDVSALPPDLRRASGVEWVSGDLCDASSYEEDLARCARVVHLAAATGKASRADHLRVNVDGTRALLDVAVRARTGGFLHVSTISVKFADMRHYPYAEAKLRAEELVRGAGLPFTIVRPTVVLGPGAAVLEGLQRLAGLPIVPMFGPGTASMQPIWIDDVVDCLVELLTSDRFRGETIDLGGPDVVQVEDLMRRIREIAGKGPGRFLHLPPGPIRAALAAVEPMLLRILPVSAGQICPFVNDGVAQPSEFCSARTRPLRGLDASLREALAHG